MERVTVDRWANFLRRNLPLVAVGIVVVVAFVLVFGDRWRRGAFVFGLAVFLAAGFRAALDDTRVGLLAVRSRPFDVGALLAMGSLIVYLAVSIDPLGTD